MTDWNNEKQVLEAVLKWDGFYDMHHQNYKTMKRLF